MDRYWVSCYSPGYRWNIDPVQRTVELVPAPARLEFVTDSLAPHGYWHPQGQELTIKERSLEIDADGNGSGNIEFEATGNANFDYSGSLTYGTASSAFLECPSDGSPIPIN